MGQFELGYQEADHTARLQRSARGNLIAIVVTVAVFGGIGGIFILLSTKDFSDLYMNLGTASAGSTTPLLVKALGGFVLGAAVAAVAGWLLARNSTARYAGLVLYNLVNNNLLEEALSEGVYRKYPHFGLHRHYGYQAGGFPELFDRGVRALQTDSAQRRLNHLNKSYTYLCQQCGLRAFPSGFTEISAYLGIGLPLAGAGMLTILGISSLGFGAFIASFADNPVTSALLAVIFVGPLVYFHIEIGRQQVGTADGIAGAVRQRLEAEHEERVRAQDAQQGREEAGRGFN